MLLPLHIYTLSKSIILYIHQHQIVFLFDIICIYQDIMQVEGEIDR